MTEAGISGLMQMTDAQLVEKCRAGDRAAFNALVGRYQNRVYGLCYHFAGDFATAQDMAQETFVRVFLDIHALRDVAKFPAWLGKVTERVCVRAARARDRHRHEAIGAAPESALADEREASPVETSIQRETHAVVTAAVARLPEPQRLAVTMHYMNGLSYPEIAAFLNVPTTTIKNRLYRARRQLKRGLLTMDEKELARRRLSDGFAEDLLHEVTVTDITWPGLSLLGMARVSVLCRHAEPIS